MEIKKTYPPSWVVMQNNIQECFKSMSIDEKRMLILASPIARTKDATEKDAIIITAEEFAKECGIKIHSAYPQLETASKALIKRYFAYHNERGKKVLSNWVIDCTYEDGGIAIRFPEIVLLMLKEFDKVNPYTKYKKDIVLKLKKDYSFDIYHLAKKHQAIGQFEMSLEHLKNELGLPPSYDKLCNLKDRVIKPSLDEITANTDIDLSYENVKKGRSVVGFKFTVREKPKPRLRAPEQETGITPPAPAVKQPKNANQSDLQHRASRITGEIMRHQLSDRFKQGDESVMQMMKRIQSEITNTEIAETWESKLEEFGIIF